MIYIDYDPEKAGSAPSTPTYLSGVIKDENGATTSWSIELKPGRNVFDVNGGKKTADLVRSHDNFAWYDERGAIVIDDSKADVTAESERQNPTVEPPVSTTNPTSSAKATKGTKKTSDPDLPVNE